MDTQQKLGVLLNTTERQSETTKQLLNALTAQIDALSAASKATQRAASTFEESARNATPVIEKAVSVAVKESLEVASYNAVHALEVASKPVLDKLSGVVDAATEAETTLKRAVASFGWKWMLLAFSAAAGGIVAVLLVGWLSIGWQRGQIDALSEQKTALESDIAELQANVAALNKKGGRIKLSECGGRLCIEASTNQGKDMADWHGPWKSAQGVPLVIPRGY
jgi:prefoldin subunit 5